jgi:uncharacterized membrane protein YfcA
MPTSFIVALALVLVGSAILAVRRIGRWRELIALCVSALAGLEVGVGLGIPHGDEGLRRIAGGVIVATVLSLVCALCVGLVQVVGVLIAGRRPAGARLCWRWPSRCQRPCSVRACSG